MFTWWGVHGRCGCFRSASPKLLHQRATRFHYSSDSRLCLQCFVFAVRFRLAASFTAFVLGCNHLPQRLFLAHRQQLLVSRLHGTRLFANRRGATHASRELCRTSAGNFGRSSTQNAVCRRTRHVAFSSVAYEKGVRIWRTRLASNGGTFRQVRRVTFVVQQCLEHSHLFSLAANVANLEETDMPIGFEAGRSAACEPWDRPRDAGPYLWFFTWVISILLCMYGCQVCVMVNRESAAHKHVEQWWISLQV